MMGHKICFYEEIWIIIPKLSLLLLLIWTTEYYLCQELEMVSSSEIPKVWFVRKQQGPAVKN